MGDAMQAVTALVTEHLQYTPLVGRILQELSLCITNSF
jgi:hypothetical protein